MGFGDAIQSFYKNFNDLSGRSSRSEYWWAYLFVNLLLIPVFAVVVLLSIVVPFLGGLIFVAYIVIHALPFCTLLVRCADCSFYSR